MRLPSPTGLLALAQLASAASVTLYLPATPAPLTLSPRTHATLTTLGQRFSAPLSDVHTFVFHNVTAGSYLVDVHCPTDGFMPLRIDVGEDKAATEVQAWETYRGNDWDNKGEALGLRRGSDGSAGFELRALGKKGYFMERPKFSIASILMNPMILMGLVSMAIFIGMPKLVENMDPETRAEWEAAQKDNPMNTLLSGGGGGSGGGQQAANPLGNFDMAAYLSGSSKKDSGNGGGKSNAVTEVENKAKSQGVRR